MIMDSPDNSFGLYELSGSDLTPVVKTTFGASGILERSVLQQALRKNVAPISPDTLVIAEEYGEWEGSKRRIDLLGLDRDANLVVIELKRDETGTHMELQALRYAAFVSTMNFEQVVNAHRESTKASEEEARGAILEFLRWDEPDEERFGRAVRIVLASADFSRELTSTVLWLNERPDMDIRCVRMRPYLSSGKVLVDIQQVIPLPEAADHQIRVREKAETVRIAIQSKRDYTHYDLTVCGQIFRNLNKRKVILNAVREIMRLDGSSPQKITEALEKDYWISAPGEHLTEQDFITAVRQYVDPSKRFDDSRYFTAVDELVRYGGQTFAFFNNWGTNTEAALRALGQAFPGAGLEFTATSS